MPDVQPPYTMTAQWYDHGGGVYGSKQVTLTDLNQIYLHQDFELFNNNDSISLVPNITAARGASIVSTEQAQGGTKSFKDISAASTTTENANGFQIDIPGDLVEGDEAWVRVPVFLPNGSDLDAPAEGGRLKWMRWRTEDGVGGNKGYADIYYKDDTGTWEFIKEGVDVWGVLATGVGGDHDIEFGKWVVWEYYIKFHSTAGIVRYWKDGNPVGELLNEQTLTLSTDVVKFFLFRTYWNGGIPSQQNWYYDNIAVALNGAGRSDSIHLSTDVNDNNYIGLA